MRLRKGNGDVEDEDGDSPEMREVKDAIREDRDRDAQKLRKKLLARIEASMGAPGESEPPPKNVMNRIRRA